mmetsp:Transcript_79647/g.231240  ORF Transcript_79647/g.231240 Transcript_79647/m.231240 type:complete len:88 (+) Transcript_79647:96-359(+)
MWDRQTSWVVTRCSGRHWIRRSLKKSIKNSSRSVRKPVQLNLSVGLSARMDLVALSSANRGVRSCAQIAARHAGLRRRSESLGPSSR